eukprot:807_1
MLYLKKSMAAFIANNQTPFSIITQLARITTFCQFTHTSEHINLQPSTIHNSSPEPVSFSPPEPSSSSELRSLPEPVSLSSTDPPSTSKPTSSSGQACSSEHSSLSRPACSSGPASPSG